MTQDAELLRRLEERLFDPVVRRSPKDIETLLADEFLEFGRSTLSLRSSVWKLVHGSWRMIFHQGTPLPDYPDSPPRGGGESR